MRSCRTTRDGDEKNEACGTGDGEYVQIREMTIDRHRNDSQDNPSRVDEAGVVHLTSRLNRQSMVFFLASIIMGGDFDGLLARC